MPKSNRGIYTRPAPWPRELTASAPTPVRRQYVTTEKAAADAAAAHTAERAAQQALWAARKGKGDTAPSKAEDDWHKAARRAQDAADTAVQAERALTAVVRQHAQQWAESLLEAEVAAWSELETATDAARAAAQTAATLGSAVLQLTAGTTDPAIWRFPTATLDVPLDHLATRRPAAVRKARLAAERAAAEAPPATPDGVVLPRGRTRVAT